jgi:amino acid transporter
MSDSSPSRDAYGKETTVPITKETHYASGSSDVETADAGVIVKSAPLARELKGRHMQMIAIGIARFLLNDQVSYLTLSIGGAIGAGLFIGSGGALSKGGPASLVCTLDAEVLI